MRFLALTEQADWAEYGLPGMVIFALFCALGFGIRWAAKSQQERSTECREDATAARRDHRSERDEWRRANEKQTESVTVAMNHLTHAINKHGV